MEWLSGYAVFHWIATWSNPSCDILFRVVTDLGQATFYYLAVAPLFWVVDRRKATVLFLMIVAGAYVNTYAKLWVNTPRPDPALVRVLDLRPYLSHSNSFPSGHAQGAVVFWGCLAWWVGRSWFTALALALIGLISFSRLYLGVHFPIDIAGGWVLGALMLPLIRPFQRWVKSDCYTPVWGMLAIAAGTLASTLTGDAARAMISGSTIGFLAAAGWLPQQPFATTSARQSTVVVVLGLAMQLGLSATLGLVAPSSLLSYYGLTAFLWVFALWIYPRSVAAAWLRLAPARLQS
ncbi:MAG: phosphatase PAP2 family protein [Deltaproteobacteria bacterium]|nr:phosphatase PAP2 family protein [Deltaproteobacteria bacterium]